MKKILILLFAGVIPVLTQYNHDYQQQRYSDYGDYGRANSNEQTPQGPDFALQQPSFFGSFSSKTDSDNQQSGSVSSVIGGSYGGLTPPPPSSSDQVNNVHKYFANERHAIVPSSLRELEESYIRSLSSGPTPAKQSYLGPFGENRNQPHQHRSQQDGVENYSGFIMTKRHYNKNDHIRSSQHQQYHRELQAQKQAQSAPITYGFPLLNEQISASNAIDAPFGRKESGKYFDYSQRNIVPNFPDFSDRPPIPEEPDIPSEEEEEQATRKPSESFVLPTPPNLQTFFDKPSPAPLSSPPPIFDRSFPEPVLQRGFIPSFGPPTKEPFFPLKSGPSTPLFHEQELLHNQIASQVEVSTTSPVPVLRPEYPDDKDVNVLPDEVSSIAPDSTEKPHEGTIYKHISVHVPAEDLEEEVSAPKVVKVAKKPEKHIKVIFIKPPDSPTQKTEVEVPATPQQKTLVYVLSESGGTRTPIKLVTPTPLKPAPPQVFFLRYTDPHTGASQPTPSSVDGEDLSGPEDDGAAKRPSPPPPIKQLASPLGPEVGLLRSAPAPVLPTFPSGFSSPATTALAQQLGLQSTTLVSPTIFTNTKFNSVLTDPTNSRYHGAVSNRLVNDQSINSNHISALKYPTAFSSSVQPQVNANNPFSQDYYSALYHLYPPPVPASVPNQNLLPHYFNPNNYPQYQQQQPQPQFYRLGQSSPGGVQPSPSSIQGLYTVAPNVKSLAGINFNSLVQNPDGKNPPRSPRNYVMMNYAPTYMPSASGSDHVPVFTSPAEFIKSLLGDSYMYYNGIANNSIYNHTIQHSDPTTTSTTTTPVPPAEGQTQAQHHTIPLILNRNTHFKNISSIHPISSPQPFTFVIGNALPVYPHLRTLYPFPSSTTTPKPQPRISWAPSTTPPSSSTKPTPKQTINLPVIIYDASAGRTTSNHGTSGDSATSHINNLFHISQHDRHQNPNHTTRPTSRTNANNDGDQSAEYSQSESSSSSDETSEVEDISSSAQQSSGEEITPIYYEPTKRANVTNESGGVVGGSSGYSSSIKYVNSNNNSNSNKDNISNQAKSRRRVNPANVKPGRRLRKVRKPRKNRKKKNNGSGDRVDQAHSASS